MNKVFKKGQMVLYGKMKVLVAEVLQEQPFQIVKFRMSDGGEFVVSFA